MSSLYEMDKAYLEALNNAMTIDEETGEVLVDYAQLDALEGEYEAKIDNIVCFIKDQEALSLAIKKEADALSKRKKATDKKIEYLKRYVGESLKIRGLNKYETARNKLTFRKSEVVNVVEESLIDDCYFNEVTTKKIDKEALKKALKDGAEIVGVELLTKYNLQVK